MEVDPARLTADLIRCPSVTPEEGGALDLLGDLLTGAGFSCERVDRAGTPNLLARWQAPGGGPVLGFAGHTDVVPPGDPALWSADPFGAEIRDGMIWGRGAVDMKSGVAAFVAAAVDWARGAPPRGGVVLLITGDEEGPATDGTVALLDRMAALGLRMDACIVGEPTCPERFGEMIKIGRRGSLSARVTAIGRQGHAAYPQRAANPLPVLARFLDRVASARLDEGTAHFEPSTLALTAIDTGNPAGNVIPARGTAALNIRFNDAQTAAGLSEWLRAQAALTSEGSGVALALETRSSGEAFLTEPGQLTDLISHAVRAETGTLPVLSTSGGTSDARFIRVHCPVAEFGLVGRGLHEVDERVEIAQIHALKAVYARILGAFVA